MNGFRGINESLALLQGVIDTAHKRVLWAFSRGRGATFDAILIYSWDLDTWSYIEQDIDFMGQTLTRPVNLEQIPAQANGIDGENQTSFDSAVYKQAFSAVVYFDTDHQAGYLTGSSLPVRLQTAYNKDSTGGALCTIGARVYVDWGGPYPQISATYLKSLF